MQSGETHSYEDSIKIKVAGALRTLDFKYNAAHDLESCFWIFLWWLFFHVPEDYNENTDAQITTAQKIFPTQLSSLSMDRHRTMTDSALLTSHLKSIPERMITDIELVLFLAQNITVAHTKIQETYPDRLSPIPKEAYKVLISKLNDLSTSTLYVMKVQFAMETMKKKKRVDLVAEDQHKPLFDDESF